MSKLETIQVFKMIIGEHFLSKFKSLILSASYLCETILGQFTSFPMHC